MYIFLIGNGQMEAAVYVRKVNRKLIYWRERFLAHYKCEGPYSDLFHIFSESDHLFGLLVNHCSYDAIRV